MNKLAFDTHKAVKALKEAGADERLAEAVVATVGEAMGENVATKADVATVRPDLAAKITAMRSALTAEIATVRSDLAALEARLYRHLWVMAAGIVGLTVTISRDQQFSLTDRSIGSPRSPRHTCPLNSARARCITQQAKPSGKPPSCSRLITSWSRKN